MTALELTAQQDGAETVVAVSGELDLASVGNLRASVEQELERAECARVRIDLGGLTFIDSTGSGCLVALRNRADSLDKKLQIDHVPPPVMRVLTISGLAYLIEDAAAQ